MVALTQTQQNVLRIVQELTQIGCDATFPTICSRYKELYEPQRNRLREFWATSVTHSLEHKVSRTLSELRVRIENPEGTISKRYVILEKDAGKEFFLLGNDGEQYLNHLNAGFISGEQVEHAAELQRALSTFSYP